MNRNLLKIKNRISRAILSNIKENELNESKLIKLNKLNSFISSLDKKIKIYDYEMLSNIQDNSTYTLDWFSSERDMYSFLTYNAYNLIKDEGKIGFFTNSKLEGFKYTKNIVSFQEGSTFLNESNTLIKPRLLLRDGLFLIEYTFIKSPDNNKYKVFLFEDKKLKIEPILSAYVFSPRKSIQKYEEIKLIIDDFVNLTLPDLSTDKKQKEINNLYNFILKTNKKITIYKFNSSLYEKLKNNTVYRKKIKNYINNMSANVYSSTNSVIYFLNQESLPVSLYF